MSDSPPAPASPEPEPPADRGEPPRSPGAPSAIDYREVETFPEFRLLRRRQRRFVLPLAAAFLLWYLAYVVCAAYARDFMATPVIGVINIGILFGLAQFVSTFAITTAYVIYAGRRLDPLAAALRTRLEAIESSGRA